MKYGFTDNEIKTLKSLLRNFSEIDSALIFGSRALETYEKGSDVDIALKGNITSSTISSLKSEIDDTTLPYFFDILDYENIKEPKLKEQIDRHGKVFYVRGWEMTTLGKIAEIIMGQSPGGESYNQDNDGLPFYQGVTEFHHKYVDIKTYTNQPTKIVEKNTILFSVRAPVGRVNFTKHKACIGRGNAGLIMKNNQQDFLYFLLKHYEREFLNNTTGTVFDSISGAELRNFEMTIPKGKLEQRAIAAVLSSLDDKIELLREQNKTLEAAAQAIYKEWFVKFNYPKASGKMINSELGKIPEGWRVGRYSDLVEVITGKGMRKEDLKINGVHKVLGANGEIGKTNEYLFDEDLILTGRVGTLGTIYFSKGRVWISDNVLISRPLDDKNYYFAYFQLKQLNFESLNRGSTQPLVTQTDLKSVRVIIPGNELLGEWHNFASSLFSKFFNNNSQIQTLARLRDTLLPKLMKGEIRVKRFNR